MTSPEFNSPTLSQQEFARRVREHQSSLFGYLSRLGLSNSSIDDIAQEAFLRAWRYRDRYDESHSQWNTWLFRIARNLAITAMKKNANSPVTTDPVVLENTASHSNDPSQSTESDQKRQALRYAIAQLNEKERDVLALAYVQGLSSEEASMILDCEPGNYRTRVSRAKARFIKLLENFE